MEYALIKIIKIVSIVFTDTDADAARPPAAAICTYIWI